MASAGLAGGLSLCHAYIAAPFRDRFFISSGAIYPAALKDAMASFHGRRSHPLMEVGYDRHRDNADRPRCRLFADARSRDIRTAGHRQATRSLASVATCGKDQTARVFLSAIAPLPKEARMLPIHVLAAIVVLLVIYLFYAVINPEQF